MIASHDQGAAAAIAEGQGGYLIIHEEGWKYDHPYGDRMTYNTKIITEYGEVIHEFETQSGVGKKDSRDALRAAISFLLACAESKSEESENYSLFPSPIREWAEKWSDDLLDAYLELNGEC